MKRAAGPGGARRAGVRGRRGPLVLAALALLAAPVGGQERDTARAQRPIEARDSAPAPVPIQPRDTLDARLPVQRRDVGPDGVARADAGAAPAADSLMRALAELPGYTATRYEGSAATYAADSGRVMLEGPARLEREGQDIQADSLITFSQLSNVVCGYGQPVLSGEGSPLSSEQICYDIERRVGMALGARTQFQERATWYVHGERVFTSGDERLYSANVDFTTCDLEVPHYHFSAGRFKIVQDQILVARDVTLNFGDVPVFWVPFLVQSLREGRRSGLLPPSFGLTDVVRTSEGHTRHVSNLGFFWAINDYLGSEVAFDWRSNDYVAMRGQFEYRWLRQFLTGSINVRQFWSEDGEQLTLNTRNSWQPDERTNVSVTGSYASSSQFVADRSYSPSELSRSLLANAGVSRRFDWGTTSLSASRNQRLLEERVTLQAPIFTLNLNSITLGSPRLGGEPVDLIWSGSGRVQSTYDDVNELDASGSLRDRAVHDVSAGSSFQLGRLSWSQQISARDEIDDPRPELVVSEGGEIVVLPPVAEQQTRALSWNTDLSYQQNLLGTATFSPRLGVRGELRDSPLTGGDPLSAPVSLDFGATLRGDLFGFWPGVGPFERFRHRLSPSFSYSYRPSANPSTLQQAVFGDAVSRQSRLTVSLNQTLEAKRPEEEVLDEAENEAADAGTGAAAGEPRRLERQRPITLLSLTTSAVTYDFERASRGEDGLTTTSLTNTIRSDLIRDLQLTVRHDLFETVTTEQPGGGSTSARDFDLHLSSLTARFGFSGDAWLFRWLGLGGEADEPEGAAADSVAQDIVPGDDASGLTLVPGDGRRDRRGLGRGRVGSVGTWRADFDYSLSRPRTGQAENQLLRGNFAFQPTENWSVRWGSGYNITRGEFSDNALTLTRALHRWDADFRLLRAQNGNFSFEFEARLSDLPDLKVPYDQRSNPNVQRNR